MRRLAWVFLGVAACATGITDTSPGEDDDESSAGAAGSMMSASGGSGGSGVGGNAMPTTSVGPGGAGGGQGGSGAAPAGDTIWINEIHYDNDSNDTGEGVELAGQAGVSIADYELELYNDGASYDVVSLNGTIPDQQSGYGTVWVSFPANGLQNGPNDGIGLVRVSNSEVVQFLSYEGTTQASDGAATGMTSVDIGVEETGTTPVGQSLQLTGSGTTYDSFTWSAPATATTGQLNNGQSFQ